MVIAIAVLIMPASATPASAASSGPFCGTSPNGSFPGNNRNVSLSQFNPAIGTLTSVQVTATAYLNQKFWFENMDLTSKQFNGYIFAALDVHGPNNPVGGTPLLGVTSTSVTWTVTLDPNDGNGGNPDIPDFVGTDTFHPATQYYTNTLDGVDSTISPYIGTGNVNFPIDGAADFNNSGTNGNYGSLLLTNATVEVCVIYTYTNPTSVTLSAFSAGASPNHPIIWIVTGLLAIGMISVAGWKLTH